MRTYGQFCPVAKAAELFCERWTPLILRDLALGASRFSELQRGVPLASPTILARRLAQLVAEGVVERRGGPRGRRTYHLTPAGQDFVPVVMALGLWGQRWSRRELAAHEVDLGLLLWAASASGLAWLVLRELAAANRRFDDFVRELNRFNARHEGDPS